MNLQFVKQKYRIENLVLDVTVFNPIKLSFQFLGGLHL